MYAPRFALRKQGKSSQPGFVLVLVLVLLALVTILVVVSSILARVERRASWNSARVELARQNALFALNVAVAQLQREAGPDQRVTARADILSSGTAIGQPYWTGVWKTYDASTGGFQYLDGETGGIAGSAMGTGTTGYNIRQWSTIGSGTGTTPLANCPNMVWLVSGGTNTAIVNPTTGSTASWMSHSVVLAKNLSFTGSTGVVTGTAVTVPLVPVYSGTTNTPSAVGKYGYWVSDEGVKARINLADPTYGVSPSSSFAENQLHFLTPQANAAQNGILGSANNTDLRNPQYASDLTSKVTTLQSLGLVGAASPPGPVAGMSGTAAAYYSPDATTYSRGVLADVRNGGLKVDLSQLFEDPANQFDNFVNAFKLWQPVQPNWFNGDAKIWSIVEPAFDEGNLMMPTEFGTRWQSLYNYYALYKNAVVSSSQNTNAAPWKNLNGYSNGSPGTTTPTIDERVYNYNSYPNATGTSTPIQQVGEYYLPHVLGFAVSLSMQSVPVSGSTYQLIVYAVPQLILYNPFNVTLTTSNSNPYTFNLSSNIFGGGETWSISVTGKDPQTVETNKPLGWGGVITSSTNSSGVVTTSTAANQITFVTGTNTFPFQPGEIKVVGAQTQQDVKCASGNLVTFDGQNGDQYIGGTPGYSQYQSIYADSSSNGVIWTGTLPNASQDQIQVSLGSHSFGSNNGFYSLSTVPAFWPIALTGSSGKSLGRFFNASPTLSATSVSINVTSMSSSTVPNRGVAVQFCEFLLRIKGMQQPTFSNSIGSPVFASSDGSLNPLPLYFDDTIQDIYFGLNPSSVSTTEIQSTISPPYDSYWGTQDAGSSSGDPSFLVLHDIPRQPMVSLGQFMHMALRNSMFDNGNTSNQGAIDTNSSLYPVGGSLADPFFALNLTNNNNNTPSQGVGPNYTAIAHGAVAYFDDNFLMNQALFDSYYFSTLPPSVSGSATDSSYQAVMPAMYTSGSSQCTNANIVSNTVVLPNARMRPYWKNGIAPVATASSPGSNYLMNYRTSSANLMMDGAFNVNSTSVQAWASLLSSLSGNAVNYLSNGSFTNLSVGAGAGNLQNPIFRLLSPILSGTSNTAATNEVNSAGNPAPWGNINSLSNSQVFALATSIVNQVKLRGPFLSMADFLNRRLDPPYFNNGQTGPLTGYGLKGALQDAIDSTYSLTGTDLNNTQLANYGMAVGTNIAGSRNNAPSTASDTLSGTSTVIQSEMATSKVPLGSTAEGAPGWLMQQDLVQCFSPVMTVRSDTFVVRCYGEADNKVSGSTEGRAWCEAVVQRVPDYLDQSDPALTSSTNAYASVTGMPSSLGDATPPYDRISGSNPGSGTPNPLVDSLNLTFGRRFKVISFRWLNESDL
jgi:hypothetical protein